MEVDKVRCYEISAKRDHPDYNCFSKRVKAVLGINNSIETAEAWVREMQFIVASKANKLFRFIINPLLFVIVKFSDWTGSFPHRGTKNGTRLAITLYLTGLWLLLMYCAIVFTFAFIVIALYLFHLTS
ncbi:MAG: hypothetical protein WCG19_06955 [Chlorobiaceae bacterium]